MTSHTFGTYFVVDFPDPSLSKHTITTVVLNGTKLQMDPIYASLLTREFGLKLEDFFGSLLPVVGT